MAKIPSIFGPDGVPKIDQFRDQLPQAFDADALGPLTPPDQPTVFFRDGAFHEDALPPLASIPSELPPPLPVAHELRIVARRGEEEVEREAGAIRQWLTRRGAQNRAANERFTAFVTDNGRAAGNFIGNGFKGTGNLIAKGWNGTGSLIKSGYEGIKNIFSSSKPYYESNISHGVGGGKILAGIAAGILAIGAVVGLSKLFRGNSSPDDGFDPDSVRAAERAAIANNIKAVQADTAMYRNQGNWTKNAPSPVANYQQAAIDQQSLQPESLAK